MVNDLYCSTGTVVSRLNGYDYTLMSRIFSPMFDEGLIEGCEFMMLRAFYGHKREICSSLAGTQLRFPVFHTDKDIGVLLGECLDSSDRLALDLYRANCELASAIGSKKTVIHLWGGFPSDHHIEHNLSMVKSICDIAQKYSIIPLFENIPCTVGNPLKLWEKIRKTDRRARFVFDTRFGEFHRQSKDILEHTLFTSGFVPHIHISDFKGRKKDFSKLRPILQPGEGQIDYAAIAKLLNDCYFMGSFTIESPAVRKDGSIDTETLKKTIRFVRENICSPGRRKYGK